MLKLLFVSLIIMVLVVIGGSNNCLDFTHVVFIADYLSQNLPNFHYTTVLIDGKEDWNEWLARRNMEEQWNHSSSPIVWKQMDYVGGKKYLIGGIDEFMKYVEEYYNVSVILSTDQLIELKKDALQFD